MIDPAAWGIQASFEDYTGRERRAPKETVDALVEALGADSPTPAPAPVRVVAHDQRLELRGPVEVQTEEGSRIVADDGVLSDLPLGYHLLFEGGRHEPVRLIVGPGRCFYPRGLRTWGWELELYALRSRHSWGIGDLGDLRDAARWSAHTGAGAALLVPLHAPNPGLPQQPSPYFPSSRCFRNPLYLRIEEVPGAGEAAAELHELSAAGQALGGRRRIDRDAVYELKMRALEMLWARSEATRDLDRYVTDQGALLERFATFCALHEVFAGRAWPPGHERPDAPAMARFTTEHAERIRFHQWVQWLLDRQLAEASTELALVHDLAIGVDPAGADAWMWPDAFAPGVRVGAPPDAYNPAGQDWGVLAFDPWRLRAAGYEPFVQTVRASLRHAGGLRFDHVMGLWRLYWIAPGSSPAEGAYVRYPARDLLEILALESVRAGAFVVGEDLGTVEPETRREMARRDILSYRLFWFEPSSPRRYPGRALSAITNHDLPTIPGLWTGEDPKAQKAMGIEIDEASIDALRGRLADASGLKENASVERVVLSAYERLAEAPSALLIAMPEDALGVTERQNHPGTLDEWPNWSLALPVTLEQFQQDDQVLRLAALLSRRR